MRLRHVVLIAATIGTALAAQQVPLAKKLYMVGLDPVQGVFGSSQNCGEPCVVTYNHGGEMYVFMLAAHGILRDDRHIIIDGPCMSSCVILADKARKNTCITEHASMHFHKGRLSLNVPMVGEIIISKFDLSEYHSKDIDTWVKKSGGYPYKDTLKMPYEEAKQFWKTCP